MDLANLPGSSSQEIGSEVARSRVIGSEDIRVEDIEGKDTKQVKEAILSQSWVSKAHDNKILRKYEVEVSTKDGKNKVEIPDEVITDSTPLWDDFVVGKFLDISPHPAKVHVLLSKIWKYGEINSKVEVYVVNAATMRFRVSNPKAREKILNRGMWNVVGVPMVVTKWSPKTEEEKQEETEFPMWVHLKTVPLHMYSWKGLSFFTSTVGTPDRLHPETIACTNLEEAKIFVNVDVSKELPKEIEFTKDGKEFTIVYHYPWLTARCNLCDKWGHTDKVCRKNGKKEETK
ncbi:unnamed protein product [Eruca vesicaria subsp. sativa]|uniref:DUF4283 domain-containing protein n=1 Tax=Eruca vesicaria subsp. sativa TaxID=29727 RepID=A0ABC8LIF8_ERUVS|nr:unnamed protein product [Eruca vesicaria subsp. sativa]